MSNIKWIVSPRFFEIEFFPFIILIILLLLMLIILGIFVKIELDKNKNEKRNIKWKECGLI